MAKKYNFNHRLIKKNGNTKLGNSIGTISKLMGDQVYNIPSIGEIMGSCGQFCKGCKGNCYVCKSYRYPSVKLSHARTTLAFRLDINKAFDDMYTQIKSMRKPFEIIRIDQSGELESITEFNKYIELAKKCPGTKFYVYTKAYNFVTDQLLAGIVPENLIVLFSIWHEYGVAEYRKVEHLKNVKAFVYADGYDYSKHNLFPSTWCKAYDEKGKMNHAISCDVCRKCFHCVDCWKVIFCNDH